MGLRFRKSVKLAPGVKLNFGKKSFGVTAGVKGAHYTINSKGKRTATAGIPGTGISYTNSKGGGSSNGTSTSGGNKNGSCLITLLKIFGIILLIPLILGFGWIAGIVWLLFFRNKVEDEKKKSKYTKIAIAVSIISFIIFLFAMFSPDDKSNNALNTEETEIESELTEASEANTTQQIETQEPTQESETTTNPEQSVSDQPADGQSTDEQSQVVAPVAPVNPAPQENAEQVAPQSNEQQQDMVWVDSTAKKYHKKSDCSGMDNAYQVTKEEAESMGKTPCGRCYR